MRDLKACLVCLSVDVKLHSINENQLRQQYYLLTGLQVKKKSGLPEYLCFECNSYMKRFIKFRDKCHRTHFVLQELLEKSTEINKVTLKTVNRNAIGVNPFLTLVDLNKMHYEVHYEQAPRINQSSYIINDIPTFNYTTLSIEQMSAKTYVPSKSINANVQENYIKNEDLVIDLQTSLDAPIKEEITLEQAISYIDEDNMEDINDYDNNDNFDSDVETCNNTDKQSANVSDSQRLDSSELEVEFATLYPITKNEAKAVIDINNSFSSSAKYKCTVCSKSYQTKRRLDIHLRIHDRHTSGNFWCELCNYHYKTQFMLNNHVTRKHMYKYVCKKCPEVNFDKNSAKRHYKVVHVKDFKVSQSKDGGSSPKRTKRTKNVATVTKKKITRPSFIDCMEYTPVSQEDQYLMVQERKHSRNYTESLFKCEMCFRGFTNPMTFDNHMKKHNPTLSGKYQCDMCKLYRKTARQLYSHMAATHLSRFTCKLCSFVCCGRGQAELHDKYHKNITYNCPHCDLTFRKISSQLTHIRIHHPSTILCGVCGNSFVSETGLSHHRLKSHTPAEIASVATRELDKSDPLYCSDCNMQFFNQKAFATHFGSSSKHNLRNHSANYNMSQKSRAMRKTRNDRKGVVHARPGRPRKQRTLGSDVLNSGFPSTTNCAICDKLLMSDVQTRKHYAAEHPGAEMPKRFMCEVCGHVTRLHENFLIHMRTHTHEKPYVCPHCDRRFSLASNRDRHLDVHSGVKRYECQHCKRRFTQKSGVKIHIQTVHLKIPYPPWNKKMRRERQALKNISALTSAVETRETGETAMPKPTVDQGDFLNAFVNYTDE